MRDTSLQVDKSGVHVVWKNEEKGVIMLNYAVRADNGCISSDIVYKTQNPLCMSASCLIVDKFITISFIEDVENVSELHILRFKDVKEVEHCIYPLDDKAIWVGLTKYKPNYDLPICSSSSSSSSSSSFFSSFSDESVVDDIIYVFIMNMKNRCISYMMPTYGDELVRIPMCSSLSKPEIIEDIKSIMCGDYFGISYLFEDKIHYNFFDCLKQTWGYVNFPVFTKTAPFGEALGNIVDYDISGYKDESLGHMPIVWLTNDAYSNLVLKGSTITTTYKEWPLDVKDYVIAQVPENMLRDDQCGNLLVVAKGVIPNILVLGDKVRKLTLVGMGLWETKELKINDWIGHVKNRKSTAYLLNNTIHVVFHDDSGVYYFSDHEKQLHKLSD